MDRTFLGDRVTSDVGAGTDTTGRDVAEPTDQGGSGTMVVMNDASDLATAALEVDGVDPFNEATRIALRDGTTPTWCDEIRLASELVALGIAFGDHPGEVVVHPGYRGAGLGRRLVDGAEVSSYWAHGDLPGARALARSAGLSPVRTLLVLRLELQDPPTPESTPEGVTIRSFEEGDADGIVEVNARAFASHPEQGSMDRSGFERRRAEPWFDPAGLFVAVNDGEQVVGFHWTKIEDGVGEVYVVGVDPSAHGGGLGTALTARGVRHLWEQGISTVDLYVEGDNTAALAVYRRLGFTEHTKDVLYTV
ncbi:mycothiol synthase [Aeromicrobium sp. CTD01-1L150]|uniref:mycothiol synthase n=1 Tax=Aeromicrobium sp. CTD01-1L150 TaxID=3341830 RepID=UPI0035C0672D